MDTGILLEEIQAFSKKSVDVFFKIMTGILISGSFCSFILSFPGFNGKEELNEGLLAGAIISGLVGFLLNKAKLITQIRADGIYVRFPPFQSSFTICAWDSIDHIFLRSYNAITEYGGFGIRFGPMGRAYNVSGDKGVQIIFKDQSKLLIGTNRPEDIANVLMLLNKFDFQIIT